jgi:hypothetical protein
VKAGLRLLEHLDYEAIEREYLTDEQGALIGRMTGFFFFVRAAPAKG